MKKKAILVVGVLVLSFLLIATVGFAQDEEECSNPDSLTFSVIPTEDIALHAKRYQPLLDWLKEKTGKNIEFYAPTSYNGVIEAMRSDFVDMAGFGAFSYILAHKKANAEVFAARVDATQKEQGYYSYMVTKDDSGIDSLEDLKNKTFAYTDPGSTSGKLIPSYTFEKADIDTDKFLDRTIFAGGHQSAVLAVKRGQVDAAAVASTVYQRMANRGEIDKDNIVVFKKSSLLPLAPQTYRADLCESVKKDIREAYSTFASEAPNADKLLGPMNATRFEPMSDSNFDRIRDIIEVMDVDVG